LLQKRGGIWLSPISVWELLVLAERGRVRLDAEPRVWVREALEAKACPTLANR
jgi:PIN domain nuclease of toxin-antitoxin system